MIIRQVLEQEEVQRSKWPISEYCAKSTRKTAQKYSWIRHYRKAFDRVWHDAIWAVLRKCGIDESIMRALEQLNAKSTNKVRIGTKFSEKFLCSVGVRQGCVLSPNLFNVFLEEIGSRKVQELTGGICVQGLLVNNLRFADDIALTTIIIHSKYLPDSDWLKAHV